MTRLEIIQDVIQNSPLYKKTRTESFVRTQELGMLAPMNFYCRGDCQSIQTFKLSMVDNQRFSFYQNQLHSVGSSCHLFEQTCQKCGNYSVSHVINFETAKNKKGEAVSVVQKIGQLPSQEDMLDKDLGNWFSEKDEDLFKKGLRCEANSYGIGAYSYFRRIVENNITKILDAIASTSDSDELISAISEAKEKHNATDRLEIIKCHVPKSLMPKGQNVFQILYDALSVGIHGQTDEQCLEDATNIRTCLGFLVKKINHDKEDGEQVVAALSGLTAKRLKP